MRNIQGRLKELRKSFPPPVEEGPYPRHVIQAALGRLSEEELLVLASIWKAAEEQLPAPPLTGHEVRVIENYSAALALESPAYNSSLAPQSQRHVFAEPV